jgi:hypothetical protein
MCKAAGKLIGNWSQNADTKMVLDSLSRIIGIPLIELVVSKVGGNIPEGHRGTWVHPKVAIHLATWCDSDFFAQVIEWTYDGMVASKDQEPSFDLSDPESLLRLVNAASTKLLEVQQQLVVNEGKLSESQQQTEAMYASLP